MRKTIHFHDKIGITSSVLCLIHCLVVPISVVFSVEANLHHAWYWNALSVLFAIISFWAIKHAVSHTENTILKASFWFGYSLLVLGIFSHSLHIGHWINYLAAGMLIGLHTINIYLSRKLVVA